MTDERDTRAEVEEHSHRDLHGGAARAAVFGASDGLVSNASLILGIAAADSSQSLVRIAGLAGVIAGAVSMAAGEYVSMKAQSELFERELEIERVMLARNPVFEIEELAMIYETRGIKRNEALTMARNIMKDPELALEVHAREELGVDPKNLGSPVQAATSSFVSFGLGAVFPLSPWFFMGGTAAMVFSVVLGLLGTIILGLGLAHATERPRLRTCLRQILICGFAGGVTFLVGSLIGV